MLLSSPARRSRQLAWARALCMAAGVHAAAIGALFLHVPPPTQPSTKPPAIAIELAVPAAPPAPVHDTPSQRRLEAPRPAPTKPQVVKKRPVDSPPLHVVQGGVRTAVPLPLPQETEHPTTNPPSPLPASPTTTDQAAPDRKPDLDTTALITGGALAGDTMAADRWNAHVLARIEMTKRYPRQAAQNDQQGDVQVELAIERTGTLRDAHIVSSRGFAVLNDAALDAVRRAAPFDAPPNEVEGDPVRISVIVRFVRGM